MLLQQAFLFFYFWLKSFLRHPFIDPLDAAVGSGSCSPQSRRLQESKRLRPVRSSIRNRLACFFLMDFHQYSVLVVSQGRPEAQGGSDDGIRTIGLTETDAPG
jgi:hypothetical protein